MSKMMICIHISLQKSSSPPLPTYYLQPTYLPTYLLQNHTPNGANDVVMTKVRHRMTCVIRIGARGPRGDNHLRNHRKIVMDHNLQFVGVSFCLPISSNRSRRCFTPPPPKNPLSEYSIIGAPFHQLFKPRN